jgi:hypothetical protein
MDVKIKRHDFSLSFSDSGRTLGPPRYTPPGFKLDAFCLGLYHTEKDLAFGITEILFGEPKI